MTTAPSRKTVAVDIDGVLADFTGGWKGLDHIGDPIPAGLMLCSAIAEFADVLIWTTRCSIELGRGEGANLLRNRVRDWLDENGVVYHEIWTGHGKPIAAAFVDDRAVSFRPKGDSADLNKLGVALRHVAMLCDTPSPGCSLRHDVTSLAAAPIGGTASGDAVATPSAEKLAALADFLERDGRTLPEESMAELAAWVRREAAKGGGG